MPHRKPPFSSSQSSNALSDVLEGDEVSCGLVLSEEISEDHVATEGLHNNLSFGQDALDEQREGEEEERPVIQTSSSILFDEDLSLPGKSSGVSSQRRFPFLSDFCQQLAIVCSDLQPQKIWYSTTDTESLRCLYRNTCQELNIVPCGKFLRDACHGRLVLNNQGIGSLGVKAVCTSLMANLTIRELYLKGSRMGIQGMKCLADMLTTNTVIKVLDVSNNDLGTDGANILSNVITTSYSLESIRATSNNFGDEASKFIGQALQVTSTLLDLDLSKNHFEAMSGVFLGQGLSKNNSLHTLDISYNHLNKAGINGLALALKGLTVLRSLNLSWNGVGNRGATQLGTALAKNTLLASLNLAGCRITITGVVDFLKLLGSNTSLKTVDLSDNPLTSKDSTTLLSALQSNPNSAIENVEIKSISVPERFLKMLEELREVKPTFTVVYGAVLGAHIDQSYTSTGIDLLSSDPMSILVRFVRAKNFRILDLFTRFDVDKSLSLTRQELVHGMQDAGLLMSITQMDKLLMVLDQDGDGEVLFSELMIAYNTFMKKMHKQGINMYSKTAQ